MGGHERSRIIEAIELSTPTARGQQREHASNIASPDAAGPRDGRRFEVEGLCCASEARQIEDRLGAHPGVASLRFDPVQHTMDLVGEISTREVERSISELGMTARPVEGVARDPARSGRRRRMLLAAASGALWLASVSSSAMGASQAVVALLALAAVATGGWFVFPRAYRAAANGALEMNFLMAVASIGALLIGEYAEAASVMFLFAVAQLLESASMDRARNAIRSLMKLSPTEATVLRDGEHVRVPAEEVRVGESVLIRPGEKIPVDGSVVAGRSAVDQATITGESIPVSKQPDDEVFAGTLNGSGVLEVRSSRLPADTTLARIIHSVEEAQASRAPSQAFVDRFARVYTPAVVGVAVAIAVLPPLFAGAGWGEWFYRALALLVIACPCALVISTPVTVVSALAGAARHGILIKGGLHLENAGRATVVAFDKTGTLTAGRPEVVSVLPFDGIPVERVLELAAAVEAHSEHPLGAAIREHARAAGVRPANASDTTALPGRGVQARIGAERVLVGSARLFDGGAASDGSALESVRRLEAQGQTVVLVGSGPESAARPIGAIGLADRVRPEAADALDRLRDAGIEHLALLTGDNQATADAIAAAAGGRFGNVRAGLLPDDKVAAIAELRAAHGPVLMVGDGINDAPALAAADVGVAMGAAGTDVALETADIALMGDDLSRMPVLVGLARKAESIIRGNIAFALLVKAVFVVLAVAGVATLWMAVLADMGASLLVIGNGMRALRVPASRLTRRGPAATAGRRP